MELAASELRRTGRAVTAFIAVIEPESEVLRWANAGHHPPILLSADQTNRLCNTTGPLLSPLGGAWRTDEAPFTVGDVCFACTDGLIESLDVEGVDLGPQGLLALIEGLPALERDDPSELAERIISRARLRAYSWNEDDITVLAFGRAGRSAGSAAARP
jgi:serine phosphatase RsbU (regulator of sigma subunit)